MAILLKYGAKINVQDSRGSTPLHNSVRNGHAEIVALLVKHGSLRYKDKNGKTPIDYANDYGNTKMIELLKSVRRPIQHGKTHFSLKTINFLFWCSFLEKLACDTYSKLIINRVLGGEPAAAAEFPWMAALGYHGNDSISFDCGGTLISDFFIITAAHCVKRNRPPVIVRLGKVGRLLKKCSLNLITIKTFQLTLNDTDDTKAANYQIQVGKWQTAWIV